MGVWSIRRGLAIFSLILYCFDQGSDFFVGSDLISKCHTRYGSSVICLVLLPGLVFGWMTYLYTPAEERTKMDLLRALFFPILFLPFSFFKLCKAVIHSTKSGETSSDEEDEAKTIKSIEMGLESYPQLILGVYIVMGLQIDQLLNYFSCFVSAASVVFGMGDMLAFLANDNEAGAPFVQTLLGMLATFIDTLFRAFFMAYLFCIFKAYA